MPARDSDSGESSVELLERVHRDDTDAVEVLLQRHSPWLWSFVRRHMSAANRLLETSEDVVQDTLRRLLQQGPRFRPQNDDEFRRIVATIVLNRLRDQHRRGAFRARREPLPDPHRTVTHIGPAANSADSPSRMANKNEEEALTRLALELCDPDDAHLLRMRFMEELPFGEIGRQLDLEPDTARMRCNKARLRLGAMVKRIERGQLEDLAPDLVV